MAQMGFFDADERLSALSAKGDPLEAIDRVVSWEEFRAPIEAVVLTPSAQKKSSAGRKPIDAIVMFKMLVLQSLYNLSDEQAEYQVRDRLSFTRFLKLGLEDRIPDATTLWLFREKLGRAGLVEKLFEQFSQQLDARGFIARGGQMVVSQTRFQHDATIVPVPKQRNTRDENKSVKAGETPEAWERKPNKNRQKDKDARWTKKHGKSHYGYKNHVNADAKHKLIQRYEVTEASVHDSQKLEGLLNHSNTSCRRRAGHDTRCLCRQRLSLRRNGREVEGSRIAQPHSPPWDPRSTTFKMPGTGEQKEEQNPRPYRACVRRSGERAGRTPGAQHRHRAGANQDRHAEPRLQHAPPGYVRADGSYMTWFERRTGAMEPCGVPHP